MTQSNFETIIIEKDETSFRLDQILTERFRGHYSRTYFQNLIDQKLVLLNGEPVKKGIKPKEGDEIEIEFLYEAELDLKPEAIPLEILYEDNDLIAINKKVGMVVHPAPGNWSGTFVNALVYHCQALLQQVDRLRPGIVHRLDKDTSGVLIAAKHPEAQRRLIEAFAARQVQKNYLAIVIGNPGQKVVEAPIGRSPQNRQKMAAVSSGKAAYSTIETIKSGKMLSLVRIEPKTGRTHQIRVHLNFIGTPVLGDNLYGNIQLNKRLQIEQHLLHAESLKLQHPMTAKPLIITAPLPELFQNFLSKI